MMLVFLVSPKCLTLISLILISGFVFKICFVNSSQIVEIIPCKSMSVISIIEVNAGVLSTNINNKIYVMYNTMFVICRGIYIFLFSNKITVIKFFDSSINNTIVNNIIGIFGFPPVIKYKTHENITIENEIMKPIVEKNRIIF